MKNVVEIHIRIIPNLNVYVAKVNKHSLPKLQPQMSLKNDSNAFLMDKKVTFKGFSCPSQKSTEIKLSLGGSMNREDSFDTSIIKIGS
jgi:hypothetical protein